MRRSHRIHLSLVVLMAIAAVVDVSDVRPGTAAQLGANRCVGAIGAIGEPAREAAASKRRVLRSRVPVTVHRGRAASRAAEVADISVSRATASIEAIDPAAPRSRGFRHADRDGGALRARSGSQRSRRVVLPPLAQLVDTPDGRRVLHVVPREPGVGIVVADADGLEIARLAPARRSFSSPRTFDHFLDVAPEVGELQIAHVTEEDHHSAWRTVRIGESPRAIEPPSPECRARIAEINRPTPQNHFSTRRTQCREKR